MSSNSKGKKANSAEEIERQLSLVILMHICLAGVAIYMFVYGILYPGPMATTIELLTGRIGKLPPSEVSTVMAVLGLLGLCNCASFFSLKKKKFKMIPLLTSVLNCLSCIGLPLGLTTIALLQNKHVKELFS